MAGKVNIFRNICCFIILLPISLKVNAQEDEMVSIPDTLDNKVYWYVDTMPVFPGNINNWIYNNVSYPEDALKNHIEGRVYVRFVVEKDGSISDINIIRGSSPILDNEAIRVVNEMPEWTPGRHNGDTVRVYYTIPIYFALKSVSPGVERRSYDKYIKSLLENEDENDENSSEVYRSYLWTRYGDNRMAYRELMTSLKEEQLTTEILLSITLPRLSVSAENKNMILKFYKDEWEKEQDIVDAIPRDEFIDEFVKISPRLNDLKIQRELNILEYLGEKDFKRYVNVCILSPGQLIKTVIANPLAGSWALTSENGRESQEFYKKEFKDDFTFINSAGVHGTYKITGVNQFSEHAESVNYDDITEYTANFQYAVSGRVLTVTGYVNQKLTDGTYRRTQTKETWRRLD